MRWTKIALLLLLLALLICISLYVFPFIVLVRQVGLANALLSPPMDGGLNNAYPYVVLVLIAATYGIVWYDQRQRKQGTHGTAHHADRREARKYVAPKETTEHRLFLGRYRNKVVTLPEQQQYQHILLTAPTGAGKSTRFFLPNLLRETGERSLFVADLKNELYQITAGWLSQQQMQIWLFAPMQQDISAGYNPLAHIRSVEDAQDFAETWVMNTGTSGGKDSFWETNSKLLISAITLHLVETEHTPAFSRLAEILTTQSFDDIKTILNKTTSQDARYIARQFLENMEKNERLVGSQMTDIANRFQLLASHQARTVTSTNTINFQEMIQTPTAFFLSIPRSATRRYRPLMACLTLQMFSAWERSGTNGIGAYLDEFTNLGYVPGYGEFISTARSLKVSLMMAIQNFSQLTERYGKNDAETIKANAVTHLLLPGAGLEECRYYSERIGDTTIATETQSRRGTQDMTSSQGETKRRLMTADEIRTMPADQMLMIEASAAPLLLQTTPYFQDRKLAERAGLPYQGTQPTPMQPVQQGPAAPTERVMPPPYAQGLPPAYKKPLRVEEEEHFFQE